MYQILLAEKIRGLNNVNSIFSYYLELNENEELVPFQTNDIEVLKEKISYLSKEKPLDMILPIKTLEICSDFTIKEIVTNESEQADTEQGNISSEKTEEDEISENIENEQENI